MKQASVLLSSASLQCCLVAYGSSSIVQGYEGIESSLPNTRFCFPFNFAFSVKCSLNLKCKCYSINLRALILEC